MEYLSTNFRNDASIGIAYLYCNFRRQHEQKPIDLLSSLLRQFLQGFPSVPESVKNLYVRHRDNRTRPSLDEISIELCLIIGGNSKSFIIIDALDECQASGGGRRNFLSELFDLQSKVGMNLFVTSRFVPEITKAFERNSTLIEIRASDEDVRRYLDGHMTRLPSVVLRSNDLQEKIRNEIIVAADGMFVLSSLNLL